MKIVEGWNGYRWLWVVWNPPERAMRRRQLLAMRPKPALTAMPYAASRQTGLRSSGSAAQPLS
jgi:hypothetical protein